MAFRKRRRGEIVVDQSRDLSGVRALLQRERMDTDGIEWPLACHVAAFDGDEMVGVVGIEPIVDSALIRSLCVTTPYRNRGIGRQLMDAARKAAHTRGARALFVFGSRADGYFLSLGFKRVPLDELITALRGAPRVERYLARAGEFVGENALYMDISRDGIIERGGETASS